MYTASKPGANLQDYIDAYWTRAVEKGSYPSGRRIYADGCADLILNTGSSTALFNPMSRPDGEVPLHPGILYLGGTMTEHGVVKADAEVVLKGIRFKPGGFYAFYRQPMAPAVDTVLPFTDHILQALMEKETFSGLDDYFSAKKIRVRHDFIAINKIIYQSKGQISVEALAKECHMSNRTLERVFKENVGIPPKEIIRIVRFQEVLRRLRQTERLQDADPESLLRIAFELGYHDHAHLTNEFRRYAGILPSELSRFYKTGTASGQYF